MSQTKKPSSSVSISEEILLFHYHHGLSVSHWSSVERSLFSIALASFDKYKDDVLADGFYSIENFRSKTQFVDAIFLKKFGETHHVTSWSNLLKRLRNGAAVRNKLAHYQSSNILNEKIGRRCMLIPLLDKSKPSKFKSNKAAHHVPPVGVLFLKDIVQAQYDFMALNTALDNFYSRLICEPERFQKIHEQAGNPPNIQSLRNLLLEYISPQCEQQQGC